MMIEYLLIAAALLLGIAAVSRWLFWRDYRAKKNADVLLFLTHTPHAFKPGDIHDGNVITRLERTTPTALIGGGCAPCWKVYGRSNAEVSR